MAESNEQSLYTTALLPPNESARLEALRRYRLLDTPPEEELDDLTRVAAALCGTPIALISLVDEHRQWFKAKVGVEASETDRTVAFCAHAILGQDVLMVPNAAWDARFAGNPLVTGEPYIRFYCGVPLISPEGMALGTICAIDRTPRTLSTEQVAGLRAIGRQIMRILNLRRQAQEDRERLRLALDASNAGAWSWDVASHVATWDANYHRLYGFGPDDPVSFAAWMNRVQPADRDRLHARIQALLESNTDSSWNEEFRAIHPETGQRWMAGLGRVTRDQDGRAVRFVGINLDITERKLTEEALRIQAEQLHQAVRAANLGFFDHDQVTDQIYWSPTMREMLGKQPDDPACLAAYVDAIHPEDREAILSAVTQAHDPAGTGLFAVEHRLVRPDGTQRWVSLRSQTFFEEKQDRRWPVRTIGAMVDITDRKRMEEALRASEEHYALAVQGSTDGLWDWNILSDEDYYLSPRWKELLGFQDHELPNVPDSFFSRLHPEDRSLVDAAVQAHLGERRPYDLEIRLRHKEGTYRWFHTRGQAVWDADGRATRMAGSIQDITDRKQAEAALRESRERLHVVSRQMVVAQEAERRRIARDLHDEVGQSLSALTLNLSKARRKAGATEWAPLLEDSLHILKHVLTAVRQLAVDLRPAVLDDLGLCTALQWYAEQQGERAGVRVTFQADPALPSLQPEQEVACLRMLQEAFTNCGRHARASRVDVRVRGQEDWVELHVSDDGIGFDVGRALAQALAGKSLGLLGMKERATLLGGRCTITSKPGGGTTIAVAFPATPTASPPGERREEAHPS